MSIMSTLIRATALAAVLPVTATALAEQQFEPALVAALAAQPEETQARYGARHPAETLTFFGIEPGMTVVETLPGGGWYTRILLSYLGEEGKVIGADYAAEMFPLFGFFSEERIEAKKTWTETWPAEAEEWRNEGDAGVSAFQLGSLPDDMKGTADAAIVVRSLHNLARFEGQGGFLTAAIADLHAVLKPGGLVGVVQHQAREDKDDEWASGARGYLKKGFVIEQMTAGGFEFVGASPVNENANDRPGDDDVVWRLPPTLATSRENPELREQLTAVGESNRMTLLFRKP